MRSPLPPAGVLATLATRATRATLATLAILAASILAGCSAYALTPAVPPLTAFGPSEPELATICVIRRSIFAQAVTFAIHDNGQLVGATQGSSYFCYLAEPGQHELVSYTGDSTDHPGYATATIFPGQRYWLQQDHENNFGSVTSKLAWLDEPAARELIVDCEYKALVEAGHEAVPPAVPIAPAQPPLVMSMP